MRFVHFHIQRPHSTTPFCTLVHADIKIDRVHCLLSKLWGEYFWFNLCFVSNRYELIAWAKFVLLKIQYRSTLLSPIKCPIPPPSPHTHLFREMYYYCLPWGNVQKKKINQMRLSSYNRKCLLINWQHVIWSVASTGARRQETNHLVFLLCFIFFSFCSFFLFLYPFLYQCKYVKRWYLCLL